MTVVRCRSGRDVVLFGARSPAAKGPVWFDAWKTSVIRSLNDSRRRGLTFDWAWRRAMHDHPPMSMLSGPMVPSMDDEVPVVEFFRAACRDAWNGKSSPLVDLPAALESIGDRPAMKRKNGLPITR